MAITFARAPATPAHISGALQRPQEHRPTGSLCNCHQNRRAQPILRSNRSAFLHGGSAGALKALSRNTSPRLCNIRRGARAALAEPGTKSASSNEVAEPKEKVIVEIDPFEIPQASPLQAAASLALTSLIGVLLFRSIRRRAKRATGVRVRSDREETVDLLAEAKANSLESATPNVPSLPASKQDSGAPQKKNPLSVLSGAAVAGVIAAGLWLFTTKVEAVFDVQTLSTNYQIRQISITIRTIVVGLAYLSTFVFAFNSVGLTLYAGQLALGLDEETDKETQKEKALKLDDKTGKERKKGDALIVEEDSKTEK